MLSDADQMRKLSSTPPKRPQANCILPIIALAVPARAPCLDIASAIAFGPVKPMPEIAKNSPNITSHKGAAGIKPAINTIMAPVTCTSEPAFNRLVISTRDVKCLFKDDINIMPKAFNPKA
ncbi:hypothetical protein D3C76_1544390 [compost metagenome]